MSRRIKCITVANDFGNECVYITADFGIGCDYVTRLLDSADMSWLHKGSQSRQQTEQLVRAFPPL
jgi:hypothetical protein